MHHGCGNEMLELSRTFLQAIGYKLEHCICNSTCQLNWSDCWSCRYRALSLLLHSVYTRSVSIWSGTGCERPYLIKSVLFCSHNELTYVTRGRSNSVNSAHHCRRVRERVHKLPTSLVSTIQNGCVAESAVYRDISVSRRFINKQLSASDTRKVCTALL